MLPLQPDLFSLIHDFFPMQPRLCDACFFVLVSLVSFLVFVVVFLVVDAFLLGSNADILFDVSLMGHDFGRVDGEEMDCFCG